MNSTIRSMLTIVAIRHEEDRADAVGVARWVHGGSERRTRLATGRRRAALALQRGALTDGCVPQRLHHLRADGRLLADRRQQPRQHAAHGRVRLDLAGYAEDRLFADP